MTASMPTQIGPYTIERELGRGGMGVVYLARDARLGRSVAVKAITAGFADDPERLARFEREARALAAVQHANIAAIYDLEEVEGRRYLVLEYVEGQTLSERLARSALPVDEALGVCAQIAAGLEAAHEAGIIHRDLKPSNIRIASGGEVKILDFGLARGGAESRGGPAADILSTPTMSLPGADRESRVTRVGMVMGTAGYMSPEQARGKSLDKRTDIWAFGCVLYECLTGKMVFGGETQSDAIAAILERDPDWSKVPARTPLRVREVLRRCLEKDARQRLRDIGDARIEIERALGTREWTSSAAFPAATNGAPRGPWTRNLGRVAAWSAPVLLLAAMALGYAAWQGFRERASSSAVPPRVSRLSIEIKLGEGERYQRGTPSPDGRMFAYITARAGDSGSRTRRMWVRSLEIYDARLVEGSEGAMALSFSPDGRWIAFTRGGEDAPVRKAPAAGGPSITLCAHSSVAFGELAWVDSDTIAVCAAELGKKLFLLAAEGGEIREQSLSGAPTDAIAFDAVSPLCGRRVLLQAAVEGGEKGFHESLLAVDVDTGVAQTAVEIGASGQVLPAGWILFSRIDALFAQRFDAATGKASGPVVPLLSGLRTNMAGSAGAWSMAGDGTLFARTGGVQGRETRLLKVTADGKAAPLGTVTGRFIQTPTPSPDGSHIAVVMAQENLLYTLAVYDVVSDRLTKLPTGAIDADGTIVWSRDGSTLYFPGFTKGRGCAIYQTAVDAGSVPKLFYEPRTQEGWTWPCAIVGERGEHLLLGEAHGNFKLSNWLLAPTSGGDAEVVVKDSEVTPKPGSVTPDGLWMACTTTGESVTDITLYPAPVPGKPYSPEGRLVVASEGLSPQWSSNGLTLYYIGRDGALMAQGFKPGPGKAGSIVPDGRVRGVLALPVLPVLQRVKPMPGTTDFVAVRGEVETGTSVRIDVIQSWWAEVQNTLGSAAGK